MKDSFPKFYNKPDYLVLNYTDIRTGCDKFGY